MPSAGSGRATRISPCPSSSRYASFIAAGDDTSASGHVAPSLRLKSGSLPLVWLKREAAPAALIDHPSCGRWQLKQLRPLVPRLWKNALCAVEVTPPGWYVANFPLALAEVTTRAMALGIALD